ncbi:MAG: replication-relaxation family protein [Candidatus Saccharimonadales bacterium]
MADVVSTKHRKEISSSQIEVVELLFKYRFCSVELLRSSLSLQTKAGLYRKLAILIDKGYVGKRYDKSYRILGKPAVYYLLPKGLSELRKLPKHESIDDNLIKYAYNDKRITSEQFIKHSLNIYKTSLQLTRLYPVLKFFTKREIKGLSYLPKNLPDAFVSLKLDNQTEPSRFFLDLIPDSMFGRELNKKVAAYIDFFEGDSWQAVAGNSLPRLLLLCENGTTEKRVQRQLARQMYDEELECYTSTFLSLANANASEYAIWSDVLDPDDLIFL